MITAKDRSRGTRGHSSLAGWRDTLIKLERRKKEVVEVTVEPRWAAPPKPFNLKFENGTVRPTEESSFSQQADKIREYLRNQGGKSSRKAVGDFFKLRDDALRKALDRAQKQNAIVITGEEVGLPEIHEQIAGELKTTFGGDRLADWGQWVKSRMLRQTCSDLRLASQKRVYSTR